MQHKTFRTKYTKMKHFKRKTSGFKRKPVPWMYSWVGSIIASALIKLAPTHRRLASLEIRNIQDYFKSDFIPKEKRRKISSFIAFLMTYKHAIGRLTTISKKARQDYYALMRQGCFALKELPMLEKPAHPNSRKLPLLIVPGLNTPTMFFREMVDYFSSKGYNVSVMALPENGLSDVETASKKLASEIERLKTVCNTSHINIIGHCLGGIVAHYYLESEARLKKTVSAKNLISLGTGFMGAEGVEQLKRLWIPRNPDKPIPRVFDELIHWNLNVVRSSTMVAYHSLLTIWDFMVHFQNGLLEAAQGVTCSINTQIIEDPAIDHLTIALNHRVFKQIEKTLSAPV
ncbi:MAG: alpha/beta fold hydrolase [Cyanobacteria bacterium P01_H01_bin.74]